MRTTYCCQLTAVAAPEGDCVGSGTNPPSEPSPSPMSPRLCPPSSMSDRFLRRPDARCHACVHALLSSLVVCK